MQKATGIGGLFFRAKDHEGLTKWYADNFGVGVDTNWTPWTQKEGMTVFQAFENDSDYFPKQQWAMWNFRVEDLDAMIEQLKANGVKIDEKRQNESYGKFAWCYDPEGNKIELWQPIDEKK